MKVIAINSLGKAIDSATITVTLKLVEVEVKLIRSFIPDLNFFFVRGGTISFVPEDFIVTGITNYGLYYTVAQVNPVSNRPDIALPSSIEFDSFTRKFRVRQDNELSVEIRVTGHLSYGQPNDLTAFRTFKLAVKKDPS